MPAKFPRCAFTLGLYYMRYYKSDNTAKLTSLAPRRKLWHELD